MTAAASTTASRAVACFHCGEPCPDGRFSQGAKIFCCHGCMIVHDLLAESGMEHFYRLTPHPGARVRTQNAGDQFKYLDDPEVERRLLDFTDGKISKVTLEIPSIHCVACVWLLENLFRLHPGFGQSRVNFARREVAISFAPERIRLGEVVALLTSLGYEPRLTLSELDKKQEGTARRKHWLQVGIAGFAFGNIMLFSLPLYLGLDTFNGPLFRTVFGTISLILALPVLVFSASDYWRSAFLSIRARVLTLDLPIALGLAALYLQSAWEILSGHGEGYLDSLAGLVFFLLCGRAFQQKTHDRISFERDYKCYFPLSVIRRKSGKDEPTAISSIDVGDRLVLRNSELLPADATLISERADIDYSFVTGEADPVPRKAGDHLYAGGRQVGAAIEVQTVKPVSQSYLSSLWSHEIFAKTKDDTLQTLTNRYSRRFTVIVLAIAFGAGIAWSLTGNPARGLKAFASTLIVACPCALALAAPFTLGTAQRVLAAIHVFLRNGFVVERLASVDYVVFDKTGTLTSPEGSQVTFQGEPPLTEHEQAMVAALASHSTHPNSVRIAQSLNSATPAAKCHSFTESAGSGISGVVDGTEVRLGSHEWVSGEKSAELPDAQGTRVSVGIAGKSRGSFVISHPLRPAADKLLDALKRNYTTALLSGDADRERERFTRIFGSPQHVHFNKKPVEKLDFIAGLQKQGRTVLMLGDGLNDAGALKQSDVGAAVVESAAGFSPASDIILPAAELVRLDKLMFFARDCVKIVRLSFGISALYNAVGISIAAAGALSPLVCAVLMPVSSISVVLFACGATRRASRQRGLIS